MKEKPILFNTEMVRAILDGRKTQTRRPVKPCGSGLLDISEKASSLMASPFGKPGDLLYVRETWCDMSGRVGAEYPTACDCQSAIYKADDPTAPFKWRPSVHMPKWAARIWLRVKRVWVERVQWISETDALEESMEWDGRVGFVGFQRGWNKIYSKRGFGWDKNPWVWCCEFERIEK